MAGRDFEGLTRALQKNIDRQAPFTKPLFHANITPTTPLFQFFTDNLPENLRSTHTCAACRRALNAYGNLCTISEVDGALVPLLWPEDVLEIPSSYQNAVSAIRQLFAGKEVSSDHQLLTKDLGKKVTRNPQWTHFHFTLTDVTVIGDDVDTSAVLDLETAFNMLTRVYEDNSLKTINTAHYVIHERLLGTRSHRPIIDWLKEFATKIDSLQGLEPVAKCNITKLYAREARPGYLTSLRGGVISKVLSWVRDGRTFADIERRWLLLSNHDNYHQPMLSPSLQHISAAERMLAQLGYKHNDLKRYWVATDELPESAILWKNEKLWNPPHPTDDAKGPIFGELKRKVQKQQVHKAVSFTIDQPSPTPISFRNFVEGVIPKIASLDLYVQHREAAAFFTRGPLGSKSPFAFDSRNPKNTMSWYYWDALAPVSEGGLKVGWNPITSIVTFPHMWDYFSPSEALVWKGDAEGEARNDWIHSQHSVRFLFCLQNAKDSRGMESLCLFPSMLKDSFHGIRKTMEAFSNEGKIIWPHDGSAGKSQVGGMARDKNRWQRTWVRARTDKGILTTYDITTFD